MLPGIPWTPAPEFGPVGDPADPEVVCAEADRAPAVNRAALATNSLFMARLSHYSSRALNVPQHAFVPVDMAEILPPRLTLRPRRAEQRLFVFRSAVLDRLTSFHVTKIGIALTFKRGFLLAKLRRLAFRRNAGTGVCSVRPNELRNAGANPGEHQRRRPSFCWALSLLLIMVAAMRDSICPVGNLQPNPAFAY